MLTPCASANPNASMPRPRDRARARGFGLVGHDCVVARRGSARDSFGEGVRMERMEEEIRALRKEVEALNSPATFSKSAKLARKARALEKELHKRRERESKLQNTVDRTLSGCKVSAERRKRTNSLLERNEMLIQISSRALAVACDKPSGGGYVGQARLGSGRERC